MSTSRRWALVASLSALVGAGVALTVRHVVRADGIPTMTPLIYRGYLEDGGRPVPDGPRMIEASLWPDATTTDVAVRFCRVVVPDLPVADGRFELRLNDECVAAVRANRDPWLQITVGATALPRTKLGAVPYAIESDRASNAAGPLLARIAALEARATAAEARVSDDCPPGWTLATEAGFEVSAMNPDDNLRRLCRKTLPDGSVDEVVRVGRPPSVFWIDRYEASVVRTPAPYTRVFENDRDLTNLLRNGRWNLESGVPTPLRVSYYARSVVSVPPARWVTWFQASELCRMSGKRLPSGDEWITAALGTDDPGDNDGMTGEGCNTGNGMGGPARLAPRNTGNGSRCRSSWGAQDMVGNVWEWTAEWFAGVGNTTQETPSATPEMPPNGWPAGYGGDGTYNIASSASPGGGPVRIGIPSAAFRGGAWHEGTRAGVYSLHLNGGPSAWSHDVGFRCVLRR